MIGDYISVKPKFYEGEWVIWQDKFYKVNYNGCGYELIDQMGLRTSLEYGTVDESAHLWTTNDAKDGDVLVNGSNIFIFHFIYGTRLMGYCHVNIDDGRFYDDIGKNECFCLIDAVVNPTTKEQRDTLMKAMADAGYTFDFEKKELKKIKQKPAWSKDDEKIITGIINDIQKRLEDYPLEQLAEIYFKEIKWLKSIKERYTWKPGDEQIVVLELASKYERVFTPKQIDILIGLKEQLKKLKVE